MKLIFKISITLFITILIFSCAIESLLVNPSTSKDKLDSIAAVDALSENIVGLTEFSVNSTAFTYETINGKFYQVLTVTFTDGQLDISDDNIAEITVYTLTDGATATDLYVRSTELTLAMYSYTNTSSTTLKLYYENPTTSAIVEVEISNLITADNGQKLLNQDGDGITGEAADLYNSNVSIATDANLTVGTALTIGVAKNSPQSTFTITDNGFDQTTGDITFTVNGLTLTTVTADTLKSSIVAHQFDYSTMVWIAISGTTFAYDNTTGILTFDLPSISDGTPIRYRYNENQMYQSDSVEGYIRYVSHNNEQAYATYVNEIKDSGAYFTGAGTTLTISQITENGDKAFKVTFNTNGFGDIDPTTLTSENVKLYYDDSTDVTYLEFDDSNITEISDNQFLFMLVNQVLDTSTGTIGVITYPTITCDNSTVSDSTDDRRFGVSTSILGFIEGT